MVNKNCGNLGRHVTGLRGNYVVRIFLITQGRHKQFWQSAFVGAGFMPAFKTKTIFLDLDRGHKAHAYTQYL
jgi:hypothetical protein